MKWRYENTGFHPGSFNMLHDESLAKALQEGYGSPTVRTYGWNPPAVSLGWNQSLEEINLAKTRESGIDVVRRPTGGRAILHSEELTYSVTGLVEGKNILSVYDDISRALVCGLRTLGVPVSIEKSQPHFPTLYRTSSAAACFSSSARYEIKLDGRKLVGSAQRRYARLDSLEVVLQHGSILIGPDHQRLVDFLNLETEEERMLLRQELQKSTTDLSSALRRTVHFEEVADAVRHGFEESWGIRFSDKQKPVGQFSSVTAGQE